MMNVKNENLKEEIIAWVRDELGISPRKIVDEKTIINSYIDGDDADDFILAFKERFNMNVFKTLSFYDYFDSEAAPNPLSIFFWFAWFVRWLLTGDTLGGKKPLYVEDLIRLVQSSRGSLDKLGCKETGNDLSV